MHFFTLHWWIRVWTLQGYSFKARHFVYNHKGVYRVLLLGIVLRSVFSSYRLCTCLFVAAMVFFTCAHCGESLKKSKVEKHYQTFCSRKPVSVTCVDCCKDFRYCWLQFYFTCLIMKFLAFIKPREWYHFYNYIETCLKHNLDMMETCLEQEHCAVPRIQTSNTCISQNLHAMGWGFQSLTVLL